jgi:hypothetical protein
MKQLQKFQHYIMDMHLSQALTKASLTLMHAIVSTPRDLISSALSTNPAAQHNMHHPLQLICKNVPGVPYNCPILC